LKRLFIKIYGVKKILFALFLKYFYLVFPRPWTGLQNQETHARGVFDIWNDLSHKALKYEKRSAPFLAKSLLKQGFPRNFNKLLAFAFY
jgi:hypothetical protein